VLAASADGHEIASALNYWGSAIAATQGVQFLLFWNFKLINNAETRALIARCG
jgi:hypothetical protein